jgi:hypothetical protein
VGKGKERKGNERVEAKKWRGKRKGETRQQGASYHETDGQQSPEAAPGSRCLETGSSAAAAAAAAAV